MKRRTATGLSPHHPAAQHWRSTWAQTRNPETKSLILYRLSYIWVCCVRRHLGPLLHKGRVAEHSTSKRKRQQGYWEVAMFTRPESYRHWRRQRCFATKIIKLSASHSQVASCAQWLLQRNQSYLRLHTVSAEELGKILRHAYVKIRPQKGGLVHN